jgi:hypothetical protein
VVVVGRVVLHATTPRPCRSGVRRLFRVGHHHDRFPRRQGALREWSHAALRGHRRGPPQLGHGDRATVRVRAQMHEGVQLDVLALISATHMRIVDGVGTPLQLAGLLAKIAAFCADKRIVLPDAPAGGAGAASRGSAGAGAGGGGGGSVGTGK